MKNNYANYTLAKGQLKCFDIVTTMFLSTNLFIDIIRNVVLMQVYCVTCLHIQFEQRL